MPVLTDWTLELSVDDVLRAQGADPTVIRERSPRLVDIAEKALRIGAGFLRPAVVYDIFDIEGVFHNKLRLAGRRALKSRLVAGHLRTAEKAAVAGYTVGIELEQHAALLMQTKYSLGLALNSLGSAAVDALGTAFHAWLDERIDSDDVKTAVPISPGLEGWPTHEGQQQIAGLINLADAGISLNESGTLLPIKSSTIVIGVGEDVSQDGSICDYCAVAERCGYRSEFERAR